MWESLPTSPARHGDATRVYLTPADTIVAFRAEPNGEAFDGSGWLLSLAAVIRDQKERGIGNRYAEFHSLGGLVRQAILKGERALTSRRAAP